jgi:hypothetical protein
MEIPISLSLFANLQTPNNKFVINDKDVKSKLVKRDQFNMVNPHTTITIIFPFLINLPNNAQNSF